MEISKRYIKKRITSTFILMCMTLGSAVAQEKIQAHVDSFLTAIYLDTIQLVDVRTPEEFSEGRLKHSLLANWKDRAHFENAVGHLDKQQPVYVYCRSGNRSNQAADWLLANGFSKVVNLEGGIKAWEAAGHPVEKEVPEQQ